MMSKTQSTNPPLCVGLYGTNGHQVQNALVAHPDAQLVAVAAFSDDALPTSLRDEGLVLRFDDLEAMLAASALDLVVLCSPRRTDQADDAIRCLEAGCAVYAEKPCALSEADLDRVLAVARATGCEFWEMSSQLLEAPFQAMHEQIAAGAIGEVVQLLVQKSYPWTDWRPDDEVIDGGLACQVGIYGARFAEHVAGMRISEIRLRETTAGNDQPGSDCRRAVELSMSFESGAIGTAISNYCNPISAESWGYELYRIFGTAGVVEHDTVTNSLRLLRDGEIVDLPVAASSVGEGDLFDCLLRKLRHGTPMPIALDAALNPTRWVLRAKQALSAND